MLIHGINLKRPVDKDLKPIDGNPICEFFTFDAIKDARNGWFGVKDGWMSVMAAEFMSDHYYNEYTNIKGIAVGQADNVIETVKHRLVGLVRSLVTDMNKGRKWGCSNYSLKSLHRTSGNHDKKKTEDAGVTCENGPRDKEPKQMTLDFDSSFPDVVEKTEKTGKKPRTYKRLKLVRGEPEVPCKTKDKVIDDIRHWQVENQKILHSEHVDIKACIGSLASAVSKLASVVDKMNAKINTITTMAYNMDRMFSGWNQIGGK